MRRAVVADDDPFLAGLVGAVLRSSGFSVREAVDPGSAWLIIDADPPDVVISDLDFGTAESGADLLQRTHQRYPQVGLVLLTSHQDPQLVLGLDAELPSKTVYQVKSALRSGESLLTAVSAAVGEVPAAAVSNVSALQTFSVTAAQAEVLRLLAQGSSVRSIAEKRGTSIRAVELVLRRLYESMDLEVGPTSDPRTAAVRLWRQGAVRLST